MKNIKKISIIFILVLFLVGISFAMPGETKKKAYYSGKTINYKGKTYIGTTNTGSFELLSLENGELFKKLTISSYDKWSDEFYDLELFEEGGRLYVHLVNGRHLYKYDITNPVVPELIKEIQDNSWDWFVRLKRIDGKLVTIGSKQIKIWNDDYQVINSYDATDENLENYNHPENITFSEDGGFFISAKKDTVRIYDSNGRKEIAELKIAATDNKRDMVNDENNSLIYVVDDESLKAINFEGKIVKEFKHTSNVGYNVVESNDANYLYFSDGIGVVKIRKVDFKPVDWAYTTNLSTVPGSWAMGIEPIMVNGKEYLTVFNGSNILLLDQNLNKVDDFEATEEQEGPIEPLYMGLDKDRTPAGSQISVRVGGFLPNETVVLKIGKKIASYEVQTDNFGRATIIMDVPSSANPQRTYVKATAKQSGLTYSTSLEIE